MLKLLSIAVTAAVLCFSCQDQQTTAGKSAAKQKIEVDDRFAVFLTEAGSCIENSILEIELGDGKVQTVQIESAYAQPYISITSSQGDVVKTREGSGYTLYAGNYKIDKAAPGANPDEDQIKLEFTLLTQDKSEVAPEIYRTRQKSNYAVGPNMFVQGKAYPMKDNFVGGVQITAVDDEFICGEIRLKSRFDVVIVGTFKAAIIS